MSEVQIIASGPVGSGKSALLGEIEILCKALGIPVRYADEAAAQSEKNMTNANWTAELDMYKPSVVLVEGQPWRESTGSISAPAAGTEKDAERLDFMAQHEAWIAHGKDGESCRLFHRNDEGDAVPMLGWGARHWRHDIREAIDAAIEAHTKAREGA